MPQNAPLWFADGPQPFHHVTLPMAVEGMPEGWTARVLYLHRPDGTVEMFEPLLKYFKAHPTRKSSWQDTVAQGLGLLWDYGLATGWDAGCRTALEPASDRDEHTAETGRNHPRRHGRRNQAEDEQSRQTKQQKGGRPTQQGPRHDHQDGGRVQPPEVVPFSFVCHSVPPCRR
jgi:hypothetical protein